MKFVKRTCEATWPATVLAWTDKPLLRRVTPPFPHARLMRFDGSHTGCRCLPIALRAVQYRVEQHVYHLQATDRAL